jgi:putative membrane protein
MEKQLEFRSQNSGNILINLIVNTFSVFAVSYLLKGVDIDSFTTALVVAIILALLNATIKPLIILLTLPLTLFTLGFFLLVINALMIFLAARWVDGFEVAGFWTAVFFSMLISIVNGILFRIGQRRLPGM